MKIILKGEIDKKPTQPDRAFYVTLDSFSLATLKKARLLLQAKAINPREVVTVVKGIDPTLTKVSTLVPKRYGIDPPLTKVIISMPYGRSLKKMRHQQELSDAVLCLQSLQPRGH